MTIPDPVRSPAAAGPVIVESPTVRVEPKRSRARRVASVVVPPTVLGTGPTDWYRLLPDLDVAWYSPNNGSSMLCFRTPTLDATCGTDNFAPTTLGGGPIGVATAGEQLIVITLDPGDTVWFEPGERHWHGAAPNNQMTHLAVQLADEKGNAAAWFEHVTDAEYGAP